MTTQELLNLATDRHREGKLAEAERLYGRVLTEQPNHSEALHRLGVLALQIGRTDTALALISRSVAGNPRQPVGHLSLGHVLAALNQLENAIAAYDRAIALRPDFPDAYAALGIALAAGGQMERAVVAYRTAIRQRPEFPDAHNNLGNALRAMGKLDEAAAAYREAIAQRPDFPEAHNNLGTTLQAMGNLGESIATLRRAMELRIDYAPAMNNLGAVLLAAGDASGAVEILRRALELRPEFAEAAYNLGNALRNLGDLRQTERAYQQAILLRPDYAEAHNNLGNVYQAMGDYPKAVAAYGQAMTSHPDFVDPFNNAGAALRTMGRVEEAEEMFRRVLTLRPDFHLAWCNLGNVVKDTGDVDGAIACYRKAVDLKNDPISHSNLVYALHFRETDPQKILSAHREWNERHARSIPRINHDDRPKPGSRLRIGYVSPDFRDHCQTLFTLPLLMNHDREAFEIYCYANVHRPDQHTEKLRACANVWRPTMGVTDAQLATQIQEDRIDVLVDLTMHMANGRPLLFARKPAPVQIAWLAYPSTTGLATFDARLTDPWIDPVGTDADYSEPSVRLPETFWCYDPLCDGPPVSELPAESNGFVQFGCLSNLCKLTARTIELWSGILSRVPKSRLALLAPPGRHRRRVHEQFAARRIPADRIVFVPFQSRDKYLAEYLNIDLGLDTLPYNGHTTSLDSFWMGVPVVTRIGTTSVGRAGVSQLQNLNLGEFAAGDDETFIRIAVELAKDFPRLRELRRTLRERMRYSALMDGPRFAGAMESVYRRLCEMNPAGR